MVAHPDIVEFAFQTVRSALLVHCGLVLTAPKTQVWSPSRVRRSGELSQYRQPDGVVVLGGPVGDTSLASAMRHDELRSTAVPLGWPLVRFSLSSSNPNLQPCGDLLLWLWNYLPELRMIILLCKLLTSY